MLSLQVWSFRVAFTLSQEQVKHHLADAKWLVRHPGFRHVDEQAAPVNKCAISAVRVRHT